MRLMVWGPAKNATLSQDLGERETLSSDQALDGSSAGLEELGTHCK